MLKLLPSFAASVQAPTSAELQQELEQFLYREAAILDNREFDLWYNLLADDIHYYMPTRYNCDQRALDRELSGTDEVALFDEDKASLGLRIRRLGTGMAWAEQPPSRTRRSVSNVQIRVAEANDTYEVDCNFMLYRSRLERQTDIFVGARRDLVRRSNNTEGWLIAKRLIILDQGMLLANNMSVFF